jgi:hypothetical protein
MHRTLLGSARAAPGAQPRNILVPRGPSQDLPRKQRRIEVRDIGFRSVKAGDIVNIEVIEQCRYTNPTTNSEGNYTQKGVLHSANGPVYWEYRFVMVLSIHKGGDLRSITCLPI